MQWRKLLYLICTDYVDVNIPWFVFDLTCINGNVLKICWRDLLEKNENQCVSTEIFDWEFFNSLTGKIGGYKKWNEGTRILNTNFNQWFH